jgi:hypothetical protein
MQSRAYSGFVVTPGVRAPSWAVCLGLLAFAFLVRAQTFGNPVLGFDEQFYLLVGDRMLQGALPYVDIFDRKPIGLFLIYAAIRELGGDGFLQYKLVACVCVALTAFLVFRATRPIASGFAACVAACLYILWLNVTGGEGGQAEVFCNLPMLMAAILTWRGLRTGKQTVVLGCAAMLLVGVAIQIKYTVLVEGVFFGAALLWARRRSGSSLAATAGLWIGCALLPTVLAILVYWRIGALQPFLFANFLSMFGRVHDARWAEAVGLLKLVGTLLPLLVLCALSVRGHVFRRTPATAFPVLWLGAAILGVLLFGSFLSPHYAIPVLVPACIVAAPFFADRKYARITAGLLLTVALIAGQVSLARNEWRNGGHVQALAVAEAAQPHRGCLYVYDGYPALYMLTHSCLPTRWVFPGHLNTSDEDSIKALGVDPVAEVQRILATRPEVIVDDAPAYEFGNADTRALVEAALARDYHIATMVKTGTARYRLVYRLNGSDGR